MKSQYSLVSIMDPIDSQESPLNRLLVVQLGPAIQKVSRYLRTRILSDFNVERSPISWLKPPLCGDDSSDDTGWKPETWKACLTMLNIQRWSIFMGQNLPFLIV